jgi:hypothetical protein
MSQRTGFLLGVLAALAIPTSASAATPDSDSVSPQNQKTTATGTITDPIGAYDLAMFYWGGTSVRGQETCNTPVCDTFTLNVAEGGQELRIVADAPNSDNVSLDIADPAGTRYNLNTVDYFTQRTLIAGADPGTWTVRVYGTGNFDSFDYALTAEINLPGDPEFVPPNDGSDATGLATARRASKSAAMTATSRLVGRR